MDFTSPIPEGPLPEVAGREEVRFEKSHPLVPQLPCMWNIIGPTGTGKSTVLVKLLTTPGAWLGKFDRIIYFVPTFFVDKQWALLKVKNPEDCVFTNWDDQTVMMVHNKIKAEGATNLDNKKRQPATLLIFDDSAGLQRSGPKMNAVDVIMALDRKLNVSVANLVQKWKTNLGSATRYNATHTSIFRLQSRDELQDILKELCPPDIPYSAFIKMYLDSVMSGLGGFFHISRFSPVGARFSAGFNKVYTL